MNYLSQNKSFLLLIWSNLTARVPFAFLFIFVFTFLTFKMLYCGGFGVLKCIACACMIDGIASVITGYQIYGIMSGRCFEMTIQSFDTVETLGRDVV